MSETPQPPAELTVAPPGCKPYWLYRLAAWVGVVAGIVFIVGAVFLAGAYVSRTTGHGGCMMRHGPHGMQHENMQQDMRPGGVRHSDKDRPAGPGNARPAKPDRGRGEIPSTDSPRR